MQTIPRLRPAISTEISAAVAAGSTPPESSAPFLWRRVGVAVAATAVLAACGGEKVYDPSNLASAPNDAQADLPAGTVIVFEKSEAPQKCDKTKAMAGSVVIALAATSKPNPQKTGKPSSSPKPIPQCEGAEVQVEVCQIGYTPDLDPDTAAPNCVHIDLSPEEFKIATGLREMYDSQQTTTLAAVRGTVDRD